MSIGEIAYPKKTREIKNPQWDSTRWNGFAFQPGDLFIDSYGKAGSHWMRQILAQLIYNGAEDRFGPMMAPRLEIAGVPLETWLALLKTQPGRRFFDSHMPLEALPFDPKVHYIYIARDPRDIVWSAHNHRANFLREEAFAGAPGWDPDIRAYYLHWLDHDDGLGMWNGSLWDHVKGWWGARHLPNVLLVHFNNLKADLEGEVRRVAGFAGIAIDETAMPAILTHCGLDFMRETASGFKHYEAGFRDGVKTLFNKGTNGRWKDVLSADEIARCDKIALERLGPDCAHWLKTGELPR